MVQLTRSIRRPLTFRECVGFFFIKRHVRLLVLGLTAFAWVQFFVPTVWLPSNNNNTLVKTTTQQYVRHNKRGKIVMRVIDKVFAHDLTDIVDDTILQRARCNTTTDNDVKEPLLQLLREAGITQGIDVATRNMLPTWKEVEDLYYTTSSEPIVYYGNTTCQNNRNSHYILGVAGLFNSGTNALTYYLRANLLMPHYATTKHQGVLTQVSWDKHWFSSLRHEHTIDYMSDMDKTLLLPIVTIRDPYTWLQSMCDSPYRVEWIQSKQKQNCPHLVDAAVYMPTMTGSRTWPTLLHLWNDWYRDYLTSNQPFVMVRLEDLLWRPQQTLQRIQLCTGAAWKRHGTFTHVVDRSKWEHRTRPQSNLVSAMIKHGNKQRRLRNMTHQDLILAADILDEELLTLFGYNKAV